jgi:hypothetical protein
MVGHQENKASANQKRKHLLQSSESLAIQLLGSKGSGSQPIALQKRDHIALRGKRRAGIE